jgi:tRNA pseudouridine55 synthase
MDEKFGFILLDKPSGPSSHDMVYCLRKITGQKRIGHAGTLDPFASGLLIMAIGRQATREISAFVKLDKEYEAKLRLGAESDTHDRTGRISQGGLDNKPEKRLVGQVVNSFLGRQNQIPPMYSAKKKGGRKLYQLAREGKTIDRTPVPVMINSIEIISCKWPFLELYLSCSSGTYVRSLARDIGRQLGCGAYLEELRRTKIGPYSVEEAIGPTGLTTENWTDLLIGFGQNN